MTDNKNRKDSQTEVNTLFKGPRKVKGIRVDENLYNRFKPVAQRVFGSVCRPIECFMAAVLALEKEAVNFGNTIHIEKIVIERNLRPRRYARSDISSEDAEVVEDIVAVVALAVCVIGRRQLWFFIGLLVQCVNACSIARSIGNSIGLAEA